MAFLFLVRAATRQRNGKATGSRSRGLFYCDFTYDRSTIEELAAIRELTLAQFRRYDDDWLWQESGWNDTTANNYWMWYHVYEDEINHRGEISWLKSRIPVT